MTHHWSGTDQETPIQSSLRKIQLGNRTYHNAPKHHRQRTQFFPACTARAKQQSGIFTQWTLYNPGGGSARRGPRSEKILQVKCRLTRHDVLDSRFGKKTEGVSSLLREDKFTTFDNNIIQWHSQISLADHEWETWKRVAREVDAIIIISNIITIIIIITRPKLTNSRFCFSIDRLESKYGCNQVSKNKKKCRSGSLWQPSQFSLKVSFDKLKFWLLTKVLTN